MRILVIGRSGQLATALARCAADRMDVELATLGRSQLDLAQPESVAAQISAFRPDIVVNAAAYTAVDQAEKEPERAFAINRDGAAAAARAAADAGAAFIHVSTDYVFDGRKADAYCEQDDTNPLNVYGRSKRDGELAVIAAHPTALVLRTSWVYSPFGGNFLKTMLKLGAERPRLRVVDDQTGNPTSALDLAEAILRIAPGLTATPGGIYHLTGSGSTTWHGFATAIFAEAAARGGPNPMLEAIATSDYPTPAQRPANSRLDCSAFAQRFGFQLRDWHEAMGDTLARLLATEGA